MSRPARKRRLRGQREPGRPGDHRCTPLAIWDPLRLAAGLTRWDLDPASNPYSTVPAVRSYFGDLRHFGAGLSAGDGLTDPWAGDVFLNPPWSALPVWISRVESQLFALRSLTLVGPGDTSTEWWHRMARISDAWTPWPRREHFPTSDTPEGSPPAPVHAFYIGKRRRRWRRYLERQGHLTFVRSS